MLRRLANGLDILRARLVTQGLRPTALWAADHAVRIVTGVPGALVVLVTSALMFWIAWGIYRLRLPAWWGALCFALAYIVSTAVTFSRVTLIGYYEAMNFPDDQLELMRAINLDENAMVGRCMVLYAVAFIGYVLYTHRFFRARRAMSSPPRITRSAVVSGS